jgi:hypothetical protein
MKNKILKEVTNWYKNQEDKQEVQLPNELINVLIDKAADAILEEITTELKDEFEKGNLKQPFFISDEYYLYLKLKDIKNNITKNQETKDEKNYYKEIKEEI